MIESRAVQNLVEVEAISGATVFGRLGGWAEVLQYGAL